ncbi:TonB-dependent siderophore receptor [Vibrio methylphosphonaticus]|uniref:TonB-dependent siderophore receptor n=1 Tax=Vibrio methylphosphonaticus TaxID=2946866 RepID=UPI00202A81C7|nr:TonB-dependent receptor [Vibrio methylphosphonaticus]MCL9776251.1 TonB-dependent receptor [Vibrio methylphosphonaticus]
MNFSLTAVSSAVLIALVSAQAQANTQTESEKQVDETLTVHAQSFDDYKVDSATGAMRSDATMLDTPQSVSVIPEIILDEQLATTLGEALQNDASINAGSKKWNREVFYSRGFELNTGTSYLRNGQTQWSHYMLPIETMERIEIIKGPSSLLYGQTTPGGLINMVSKRPTHKPMVNIGTDFDDLGSSRIHIDASGALNESGSIRGRTVLVKQDTIESRKYANGDNRERDRFLGYGIIEADLSDWGLASFHYERTQDKANIDSGAWLDSEGNPVGGKDAIHDMSWAYTDITVDNIGGDVEVYLGTDWTVKAAYNHQLYKRQRHDSSPRPTSDTINDGSYEIKPFDRLDDWQLRTFSLDLNGDVKLGNIEHKLLFGTNGRLYDYEQYRESGTTTPVVPGTEERDPGLDYRRDSTAYNSDNQFYGFYAQDLMTINDHWQVLIGGRYDLYYADNGDVSGGNDSQAFSPKVGVIFHPAYNGSIYANYSESFEPTSSQDDGNGNMLSFDPATAKQYEVGTKWELLDNSLLLTGAVFDITKNNILLNLGSSATPVWDQGASQHHKGAEATAQGQVSQNWFVMASGMYLDAEYENHATLNGKTPANVPEWTGSAWTRYAVTEATALNIGLFYQGERWADNNNTLKLDGYTRIDTGASHKVKSGATTWDFRFNIENLFDTEYIAGTGGSSSEGLYTDVHYGNERRLKLSVNATF